MFKSMSARLTLLVMACMVSASALALADALKTVSVRSGDLVQAIESLAKQCGIDVIYPSDQLKGLKTHGVSGTLEPKEAFRKLLEGTPLILKQQGDAILIALPRASTTSQSHEGGAGPAVMTEEGKTGTSDGFRVARTDPQPTTSVAPVDQKTARDSFVLQEVVVTAQKREERLLDTPQSVSVLSADQLSELGALQFRDFANTVPGLTFSTAGAGYTQVSLRGVTLGQDTSPTVGIYVDEVPFGSSTGFAQAAQLALDVGLFDIDRIEILRGPQGTLYGASTMGGLIKYVSRQPDASGFYGSAQAGLAYTESGGIGYNAAGVANVPLVSDVAALRASAFESHDGGYIDNVALGHKDVNRSDVYGGRLDLLVKASDRLTIRLGGFLQDISRDGQATADYSLTGTPQYGALDQSRLIPEPFEQQFRLVDLTLGYDFGVGTFTSISSYQTMKTHTDTDYSSVFVPLLQLLGYGTFKSVGVPQWVSTDKFTQEIRLASNSGEHLDWLVGGFYTHEDSQNIQSFEAQDLSGQQVPNIFYLYSGPTHYKEYAEFGDLTWHATKDFDVLGGIRFAHNSQDFTQYGSGALIGSEPRRTSQENVVTYLADARYHFNDYEMGYLRYATGYRPGGPNFVANDPITGKPVAPATFEADKLKSYEIGFKAQSADHHYELDAAAYWINWSNIQVLTTADNFSVYANASGGAYIPGGELTLTARPTDPLTLRAAIAYNDAHLRQDEPEVGGLEGERLPNVARVTAAGNIDYVLWSGGTRPSLGSTVRYVSSRDSSFDNSLSSPQYHLPAYTAIDLRGGLTLRTVNVQLYVHNLFNERGQISATTNFGFAQVALIQPLTFGITATANF